MPGLEQLMAGYEDPNLKQIMDGCNDKLEDKKSGKIASNAVDVDSDEEMIMNSNEDFWPEP